MPGLRMHAPGVRFRNLGPELKAQVKPKAGLMALFPGWLPQLLTTLIHGLESYEDMIRALTEDRDAIKVFVEVASLDGDPEHVRAIEAVR